MSMSMSFDYSNDEVRILVVGDVVKDHGVVAHIHTEGEGDSEKRVVGFGTPAHIRGDGEVVAADVQETKIWSPARKVKRVEVRLVSASTEDIEPLPRSA